eukprot:TRINITY_DN18989_c0_g1_i1.p1 TRINITY_DN18989_c0_g1~~TRINITY_DN18989_c0_g1_i1.p1  ORF type:complete len:160 (-),score=19.39 TRINITY_DN18989_c0_g1_i1:194-673(-)
MANMAGSDHQGSFCDQVRRMVQRRTLSGPPPLPLAYRRSFAGQQEAGGWRVLESLGGLKTKSSNQLYLDEMLGLVPESARPSTRDLLTVGAGRKEYLKRRNAHSVQGRYTFPITESMQYGFDPPKKESDMTYRRKPLIRDTFFRKQGFATYVNLPVQAA